jgi:NAD(P)-dependent dehydrogenase (short-subunit alcohol dehydrogenase family)
MRMDLNPYGIRVGAIHPGMVESLAKFVLKAILTRQLMYIKDSTFTRGKILPISLLLWYPDPTYCVNIADLIVCLPQLHRLWKRD